MSKKSILIFLIAFVSVLSTMQCSYAAKVIPQKEINVNVTVQADEDDCDEEASFLKKFSLKEKFKKTPETQIKDFFKKYNKYSAKNKIDKLKEMYTDDYVNNDGFNKESVFKMMELSADIYKDVEYSTEIESIDVSGNYAIVKGKEIATGETENAIEKLNDTGKITSELHFIDYMKKEGNSWKISVTDIIYEKVLLSYGEAKSLQFDIIAPESIAAGAEYDVTLKTQTPESSFLVASITNDRIIYPQEHSKEVYRAIKKEELSRILKANKTNNNEYATASIALTKAKIESSAVALNMTGIAFIMKRVNVIPVNENLDFNKENLNAKQTADKQNAK